MNISSCAGIYMIRKADTLGDIVSNYPEVVPVLAQAGLHCMGCHVSAYETLEHGCLAHGMAKKDIEVLVKKANEKIAEYEKMPKVIFTDKAIIELDKRLGKPKKKFVRIVHNLLGEFDFQAEDNKEQTDELIPIKAKNGKGLVVNILADRRIEKMLRGIKIDYDLKEKDFVAQKV